MTSYVAPAGSIPTLPVPSLDGVDLRPPDRGRRRRHAEPRPALPGARHRRHGIRHEGLEGARGAPGARRRRVGGSRRGQDRHADAVVISSAIGPANVELAAAREAGLPVWARQQALAALAAGHRAIAVAGTHGKTTTTSMIAVILEHAGADPSYLIGGDLNESGSGARSGSGDSFVFEADESDGSFLLARPAIGVITNVEVDHVDFYPGGRAEIESAFTAFADRCGLVVACGDDPGTRRALAGTGTSGDQVRHRRGRRRVGHGARPRSRGGPRHPSPARRRRGRARPADRRRPQPPERDRGGAGGRPSWACRRRSPPRRSARSPACTDGSSSVGARGEPTSTTTTGTRRRRWRSRSRRPAAAARAG